MKWGQFALIEWGLFRVMKWGQFLWNVHYNRWGQKLFDTNDITAYWDGTYLGTPVKEDTYTWQIIYTLIGHHTETVAGHINVIR